MARLPSSCDVFSTFAVDDVPVRDKNSHLHLHLLLVQVHDVGVTTTTITITISIKMTFEDIVLVNRSGTIGLLQLVNSEEERLDFATTITLLHGEKIRLCDAAAKKYDCILPAVYAIFQATNMCCGNSIHLFIYQ
jgi:hypothetical protein